MIKNIAVLGAGTMGHGIAEAFAVGGYLVMVYEPYEVMRDNAKALIASELDHFAERDFITAQQIREILDRIKVTDDLEEAVGDADYVIEATAEDMALKQNLFKRLDEICKSKTILASNTSSLPLGEMICMVSQERKKRAMVCHWFNPAHIMPLVELSAFGELDESVLEEVEALYRKIGKRTIRVKKDVPGLVANRMQQGLAREVFSLVEQGVASAEDIDRALKFGIAFRFATTGLLEVADRGGLDVWAVVGDNILASLDNQRKSNPILHKKVAEGKLGFKSGEGFFQYPGDMQEESKRVFTDKLLIQLKTSVNY